MFKNNVKYKFKDLTAKLVFLASNNNIAEFFNRAIGPMDDLYSIEVVKSDGHGVRAKHIKVNGSYIYWDGHKDYYMLIHGMDNKFFEEINETTGITTIAEATGDDAAKTEIKKSVDLDSIITQEMKKSGAVLKLLNFANTLDLSDENRKIVISIAKDIRSI